MSTIIDLTKEYEPLYFVCLEDWSDEMKEAGDHKARWYNKMKDKGLRVKLALDDDGTVCGMIEYLPVEHAMTAGQDAYFINCLWVHGHKQGVGDRRKQGHGKALLQAAEDDARAMGAKGMAAFGLMLPVWIPAGYFRKRGYTPVDRNGITVLLFKSFAPDAAAPKLIRPEKTPEKQKNKGKVTVTFLLNGYCPGRSIAYERVKRIAAEFGDSVVFETVDTSDRETFLEWGVQNELFIEDKRIGFGPPPSYDKLKKLIGKRVHRLKG